MKNIKTISLFILILGAHEAALGAAHGPQELAHKKEQMRRYLEGGDNLLANAVKAQLLSKLNEIDSIEDYNNIFSPEIQLIAELQPAALNQ